MRKPNSHEIQLKNDCLREMTSLRARLIIDRPFTATLSMNLELTAVVDSRLKTAATDGESIFFNACYVHTLDEQEKMFLLAHEVWHCAASHLFRRFDRDETLWNYAADHEINSLLVEDGFMIPRNAVFFRNMKGRNAEFVYDYLNKNIKGSSDLFRAKQFDQHDLLGMDDVGPDPVFDSDLKLAVPNDSTARKWKEILGNAAQKCREMGTIPGGLDIAVGQLIRPTLPWRIVLRQFVQRVYGGSRSWWPPSRRYVHQSIFLPAMQTSRLKIALAIDTSHSTKSFFPKFLSEFKSLMIEFDRCEVTLIECDCEIQRVTQFDESEIQKLAALDFKGGGGTSFRPVFDLLDRNHDSASCLVYLTDGIGDAPDQPPAFPVIWILTPGSSGAPVNWGEEVYLDE